MDHLESVSTGAIGGECELLERLMIFLQSSSTNYTVNT